jgi:hypothetical protein
MNQLLRLPAPVAEIIFVDRPIDATGVKVKHIRLPGVLRHACMASLDELSGEAVDGATLQLLGEVEELVDDDIAGAGGDKVKNWDSWLS